MAEEQNETEKITAADEPAGVEESAPAEATATTEEAAAPEEATAPAEPADAEAVDEPPAVEDGAAEAAPAAEAADDAAVSVHTYEELKGMTVVRMREIAEGMGDIEVLHGYTTMHKEELLVALCRAQGIEAHEHHEVVGIDKVAVKAKIRELKKQRQGLIDAKDSKQLRVVRRRIRSLKRKLHKATV
jgi:hypothetical protein